MLLRKGRFIERRRVAYRLVGVVRGESLILSDELFADARDAQAAVESAVPDDAMLDQVALQRGELASPLPPLSDEFDSMACRWEVIKRWGPDVIARIRRQRDGTRTKPLFTAPIAETPADLAPPTPLDTPQADVASEHPQPAGLFPEPLDARLDPPASDQPIPPSESEPQDESPAISAPAAALSDTWSPDLGDRSAPPAPETPASEIARVADDVLDAPASEIVSETSLPPAAPEILTESSDAPASPLLPAATIALEIPAPLRYRPWRGAVIRTLMLVCLLLLAVIALENCSNPFAWLTSESYGNEVHSLPFQNHGDARPAAGPSALTASTP